MEIGVIIFIVWLIISAFSGVAERMNKKGRNTTQPPKRPSPPPQRRGQPPQKSGPTNQRFPKESSSTEDELKELKKRYKIYKQKAEKSITSRMSNHYRNLANEISKTLKEHNINIDSHDNNEKELNMSKEAKGRNTRKQETLDELFNMSKEEMSNLRNVQSLQIQKIEEQVNDIIEDKNLSKRTKQAKIRQIYLNNKYKLNEETTQFNQNQVVNGIIWSEILKRPEELK